MTFATFPESGYRGEPGGTAEIPGFDPNYETVPARIDQDGDDSELQVPLNKGETVQFEAFLFISGGSAGTVTVQAPTDSHGGFQIMGNDNSSDFQVTSYGSASFNTGVFEIGAGAYIVTGVVGASSSGMFRLRTSAGTLKAGSQLRIYRLFDSKVYA